MTKEKEIRLKSEMEGRIFYGNYFGKSIRVL